MYLVKNSPRALFAALIPLAIVEAVLMVFAIAGGQVTDPAGVPAPDQIVAFYAGRMAMNAALLFAGHIMLRQWTISSRLAYGLMGGVMAAVSCGIAMRNHIQLAAPGDGTVVTIGLLPTIAGMIGGFLYGQFAGLSPVAGAARVASGEAAAGGSECLAAPLVFDGPVQVRTSIAGIAIAAVMPATLATILPYTLLPLLMHGFEDKSTAHIFAAVIPAQTFLTMLVVTVIPSTIFMLCVHHIARAMGRCRAWEYAAIGAAIAFACMLLLALMVPLLTVLLVPAAFCAAVMGALYRRFAGIEPLPLPEAVIATDSNTLVGADHPSRRQHGVILSN
ncbi:MULTISPECIES: hypothetical protein [unclassified Bradyrhizobium]|uniref:hypothetical protein n=1 Tax=unclassified Bradyrhizobium TaxID=2631580 RepID=UPI00247B1328|nr:MULTISPECIES: hypothetical protein [unclassified Bradyrhizobium]WGR68189.1 hypothetical protein MTX24_22350 [Bradyrhizobium sp. ISRA426]WGR80244.1 hypothetical protein MTX21_07465 [Bradyrhizobium sp. ISRA430]WGR83429.1 hypothetical protein MTX25_22030 [Bradyrhizobium sp. ISRA432]